MRCEYQGRMMDSETSVPERPMKIIFQQTGFRDKEIPGGGSSMSQVPGPGCIPQSDTCRSLGPLTLTQNQALRLLSHRLMGS